MYLLSFISFDKCVWDVKDLEITFMDFSYFKYLLSFIFVVSDISFIYLIFYLLTKVGLRKHYRVRFLHLCICYILYPSKVYLLYLSYI